MFINDKCLPAAVMTVWARLTRLQPATLSPESEEMQTRVENHYEHFAILRVSLYIVTPASTVPRVRNLSLEEVTGV